MLILCFLSAYKFLKTKTGGHEDEGGIRFITKKGLPTLGDPLMELSVQRPLKSAVIDKYRLVQSFLAKMKLPFQLHNQEYPSERRGSGTLPYFKGFFKPLAVSATAIRTPTPIF